MNEPGHFSSSPNIPTALAPGETPASPAPTPPSAGHADTALAGQPEADARPAHPRAERSPGRTNDPERTKSGILEVATAEFAERGYAGARIDAIAATTRTSKRMIYYYFGSKEGLYIAVLEEAYRRVRGIEADQHLADLAPLLALRRLVEFTFDHHASNPDFIRLVMSENMERGAFLARSKTIEQLNVPAIAAIGDLYQRGVAAGVFRPGLDAVDIHASISALTFFNVSNQHTFGLIFKEGTYTPEGQARRREAIVQMITRYLLA